MKKIIFVINTLSIGGAEKALLNLSNGLVKKGYKVDLLVLFKCNNQLESLFDNSISIKYLLKNRDSLINKVRLTFYRKNLSKVFKIFKDYDVIFSFLEEQPLYFVSKYVCNSNQKKYAMFHTVSSLYLDILIKLYGNKDNLIKYLKTFNNLICVSNGVKNDLLNNVYQNERTIVLSNVLEIEKIKSISKEDIDINMQNNLIKFCFVGRIEKEKGLDRLIEAFKKYQDISSLLIVGDGSKFEECKKIISDQNIKNVKFVGYQSNPYKYMSKCDALVSSSYIEGLSTVALESLIIGKPFISTDVCGVDELLKEFDCGIKCENSLNGLTDALNEFIKNKNKYIIEAQKMSSYLEKNNIIDKYINLIEG